MTLTNSELIALQLPRDRRAVNEAHQVRGIGHQGRDAHLQESMRSHAGRAGHRAWYRTHRSTQLVCALRHRQRARTTGSLDDRGRTRQRSLDSCPRQEPGARRNGAWRKFTHEKTEIADAFQQLAVPGRVRTVETAAQYGDRMSTAGECGGVHSGVDPIGAAGDQHLLLGSEVVGEHLRDVGPVVGGGPRSSNGEPVLERTREK